MRGIKGMESIAFCDWLEMKGGWLVMKKTGKIKDDYYVTSMGNSVVSEASSKTGNSRQKVGLESI